MGEFDRMDAYLAQTGRRTLTPRQLRASRRAARRKGTPMRMWWYLLAVATGNRQGLAELYADKEHWRSRDDA